MIWKRVTEYMVTNDASIRREIRKAMALKINDGKRAKKLYDALGTDADCSCNDYHYSRQALTYLQNIKE